MKKNLNIIQIKGIRGLIIAGMIACCLAAGFIVFPGWVWMNIWNQVSVQINGIPSIGLIQGILLWGIMIAAYYTFRKDRVVVCLKSPEGLSEEELKTVFDDIKKQTRDDAVLQAMIKTREMELNLKNNEQDSADKKEDSTKV